ncbi:PKD domain-containing protein [Natronorubrum tibetense]|uniref:Succinylglutamate desuccinylase/aspartoacylase n=1 Tax=Natronorubrum tibetense GA33 TaxID=1114856 RepID=L9VXW8_9EURY|nr:PKD domain-containing protein [Natronorubrum tibetense]ELY41999.1 succinylglutamate desuccinylase/aspartoacylase [Natronorubrum tibetense GA33]
MQRNSLSRRTALSLTAGSVLAGIGATTASSETDEGVSRESFEILEGTDHETTVHVTTAQADGPTVVVVGGVHGNEVAGYVAAHEIADWTIEAGTLVTIPEADAVAVDRGIRTGEEGVDLNRQFSEGSEPETKLARALWDVVAESDPDVVLDLHESTGIYAGNPVDGVGQAIFHSDGDGAPATAAEAADYVTRNYVDDPDLAFQTGRFSGPNNDPQGLLVHKAARDLDADAYLVETLSTDVDLETRVRWHSVIAERLVEDELFPEEVPENGHVPDDSDDDAEEPVNDPDDESPDETDDEPEETDDSDEPVEEQPNDETPDEADDAPDDETDAPDRDSLTATITTDPSNADELSLESGQTIVLDGSRSCVPGGEIVCYEWDVGHDGCFDATGETLEVTISANGEHTVVLRVTDDTGATAGEAITFSAS